MKNIKRITTIALAAMMSLTLMACGKTANTGTSSSSSAKAKVSSASASSASSSSAKDSKAEQAKAAAKTVEDKITAAIKGKTAGTYDKGQVAEARTAYDALTAEEKTYVPTQSIDDLTKAETDIAEQEEAQRKAEEEAQKKEQERLALEEKQRAEAERQAEEARQAQARQEQQQSTGGNTGNTGNTGSGSGSSTPGKWGAAPEGYTQELWDDANRQIEEAFGEGAHLGWD